jgi:type VI secretion system protein VasG
MVPLDLRRLLGKLDPFLVRLMEGAAGLCLSRAHHEVTIEHLLFKMVEDPAGDVAPVLAHFEVDVAGLQRSLADALEGTASAHSGKPVLSPLLVEWIEDGWMVASVEWGDEAIRSAALLIALASRLRRYLAGDHPELEKIRVEELRRDLAAITAGSAEGEQVRHGRRADSTNTTNTTNTGATEPSPTSRGDSALARFATDFTALARAGKIDPVFGRDAEIRKVVDILARRRKNNPIIVGEAGVGKTAIVEGLALRIAEGDVPDMLKKVAIWALDLGLLQAGAGIKGEFESRLKAVIDEVKASASAIIVFIDEAHTMIGAGGAAGGSDAANLLKPALARGELRTIAATTWAEYKKYFEEDAALARRFQPVVVDEPSPELTALMLRGIKGKYETAHGVEVRDDAIEAAARLSARYIAGRLLPDKAVDLLDTAAARVKIGLTSRPGVLEDLERLIAALERQASALARDERGGAPADPCAAAIAAQLASARDERASLEHRWHEQREAVERVLALRRQTPAASADALASALAALKLAQGSEPLVRLEVEPDVVAQVVGDWTGVPVGRMVRDEAAQVMELETKLAERIQGQPYALSVVGQALRSAKLGLKDPRKPQVFLLVGPSGVGKTELGLAVGDQLFGGERFVISINMSEYQDREMGVSGLIGAKPGYVGYGKGGALTEAVRQRPYSVVLLDEIEKSCAEVRNLFYQVFDKGDLTDGTGRRIDFKNAVLFLTTNLTADLIQSMCDGGERALPSDVLAAIRPVLSSALQPAWLARTTIVPFYPLEPAALRTIARQKLARVAARIEEAHRVEVVIDGRVAQVIADRCTEVDTGARNIDFLLEGSIAPQIGSVLLQRLAGADARRRIAIEVVGDRIEVRLV